MANVRHFKRLIRNMRMARELAQALRECKGTVSKPGSGGRYKTVPSSLVTRAINMLDRLGGAPPKRSDEHR